MATNSTLTISSSNKIAVSSGTTSGTATISLIHSGSQCIASGMQPPIGSGGSVTGTVSLERLSDPTIFLTDSLSFPDTTVTGNDIWLATAAVTSGTATAPARYVVVDEMPIQVIDTSGTATPANVYHRSTSGSSTAFWRPPTGTVVTGTIADLSAIEVPTQLTSGSTAWFPWNNRPFISAAELMLVPQNDSLEMLKSYQRPTPANQATVGIPVAMNLLFDAVHVPTRFAGIHATGLNDVSSDTGIFNAITPVNQFSSFREPGRVNLNTVVSGTAPLDGVWNAVVAGRLATPIKSGSTADFDATPAHSLAHLLALTGTSTTVSGSAHSSVTTPFALCVTARSA